MRLLGLLLIGLATLLTAVALVETFRGPRASGMTNERLPLFAQSAGIFAAALLVLASLSLLGNTLFLLAQKNPGSFDWYIDGSGRLLHGYEWVFSQAIVAIVIVLALGIAAEIVATFHRGALTHRRLVTVALLATGVLVAIVPSADSVDAYRWGSLLALLATIPVAAAAVVLLLAGWSALRAGGRAAPLPFALGSLVLALGATVLSLVLVVAHDDLRGTTFESARLDLVWTSVLLALLGGAVYWWPKLTGRMLEGPLVSLSAYVLTGSSLLLAAGGQPPASATSPLLQRSRSTVQGHGRSSRRSGCSGSAWASCSSRWRSCVRAVGAESATTRGAPTRSSGTRLRPPPPHNFDSLPPVTSERPLDDLRRRLKELNAL